MPAQAAEEFERQIDHHVRSQNESKKRHDNLEHIHTASTLTASPNGTELVLIPRTIKSQIGNPVSHEPAVMCLRLKVV